MGDPRGVLVVAHRGDWFEGQDAAPANSIQAVLAALAAGADGAEVDARLTADGSVVLHHDAAVGMPDLREGCRAALGTPLCDLARRELAHLSTLAGLLDAMEGWVSGALAAGRLRPVMLNIELKDLPGEPGATRNDILARDVAQMLVRRRVGNWPRDWPAGGRARAGAPGPSSRCVLLRRCLPGPAAWACTRPGDGPLG